MSRTKISNVLFHTRINILIHSLSIDFMKKLNIQINHVDSNVFKYADFFFKKGTLVI